MIRLYSNYKLIVPHSKLALVRGLLDTVTKKAGGVTECVGLGNWFDAEGKQHPESVLVYSWWTVHHQNAAVRELIDVAIVELLNLGEQTVMLEHDGVAYIFDSTDFK